MADKKRIFKLAEELKIEALEIIAYLKSEGIEGISAASHVDGERVQDIKDHFSGKKVKKKPAKPEPAVEAKTVVESKPPAEPVAEAPKPAPPLETIVKAPEPKVAAKEPEAKPAEAPPKPAAPAAPAPPASPTPIAPAAPPKVGELPIIRPPGPPVAPAALAHPPRPRPGGPVLAPGAKPAVLAPRKPLPGGASTPTETIRQHIGIKPRTFTRPGGLPRPGGTFHPPGSPRPAGSPGGAPSTGFRPRQAGSAPAPAEGSPAAARDHRGGSARPRGPYRAPQTQEGKQDLRRGGRAPLAVISRPAPFQPLPVTKSITLTEGVSVKELAEKLDIKAKDIIKRLLDKGMFATLNQALDETLAIDLSRDFGAEASIISYEEDAEYEAIAEEKTENVHPRSPVVTIMGHVDHGKTSLLDAIRETNVTSTEAGGITQHIGAYQIEKTDRTITFLDTPGHEAFTMMRARGAKVTDIVVLVVAADDGVMPQTLEAIAHARAAKVPIVVAINKIDKPNAQVERVRKTLGDNGLLAEDWGGDTVTVEVSAKQKTNLDLLLEMILLVADIQGLKANPQRTAMGTILEAKLDKGRGPVATVLVQNGSLNIGDSFIVGAVTGKVRAMYDYRGTQVKSAGPSVPVEVLGLEAVPHAGDLFQVLTDVSKVKQIGSLRQLKQRESQLAKTSRLTLEHLHEQMKAGAIKELPLILKADVQGSVEVLSETLSKLGKDKVKVKTIHKGTGAITETDVLLASASNAIIIGFNVRPERKAADLATHEGVDIRLHTIIYNITNEIKSAMVGMLDQQFKEAYQGTAAVRETFKVPKVGVVAGCSVTDGKVTRNSQVRLLRDNVVVYEGKIASLKRFKDDASEVRSGFECGIGLENFGDIKVGDVIEAYILEKLAPESL
ncbi:MAG: translation initiation factor IF-2 [Acidobacteria bacterium]|nr:translation initiation factor IF-2 [Acidobacteriota bacterium]MCI0721062.1 translation initiation factor IF-2 [Acidobacteriota bacterium]